MSWPQPSGPPRSRRCWRAPRSGWFSGPVGTASRRTRRNCCSPPGRRPVPSSRFGLLPVKCLTEGREIGPEGGVYTLTVFTVGVKTGLGFIGLDGPLHQKPVVGVVLHKRLEGPGAEFFGLGVIQHFHPLVRSLRLTEKLTGLTAVVTENDGLKAVTQQIVQGVRFATGAVEPGAGGEHRMSGFCKNPGAHVVIKGVEPFMGQRASPGILGQGQLAGGRDVVGRHSGAPTN